MYFMKVVAVTKYLWRDVLILLIRCSHRGRMGLSLSTGIPAPAKHILWGWWTQWMVEAKVSFPRQSGTSSNKNKNMKNTQNPPPNCPYPSTKSTWTKYTTCSISNPNKNCKSVKRPQSNPTSRTTSRSSSTQYNKPTNY